MTPPPHPSPCGNSVHSETTWKPHLKGLPPQYPGTLRPRDLILHWELLKSIYGVFSLIFLNLLIFNLLSSKGIKGAQLCSQHWGSSHGGSGRHPRQHGGGRGRRFSKFMANSHRVFVTAAQLLWVDCQCYGTHWRGIPSCNDSAYRRNSGLNFHAATRVSVMSVFLGTRVSVGPDEGTAVCRWT